MIRFVRVLTRSDMRDHSLKYLGPGSIIFRTLRLLSTHFVHSKFSAEIVWWKRVFESWKVCFDPVEHQRPVKASQEILLPACPGVLVHVPFGVTALVLQRSSPDLKQPHRHSRPHLRQLDALIPCPDEDMVANFNAVFNILECYYPVANLLIGSCGFSWWEKVFENLYETLTKRGRETLEK